MVAKSLEGKLIANSIIEQVKKDISFLSAPPRLVSLLIGNDKGAISYAKIQKAACESVGIVFELIQYPRTATQEEVVEKIFKLNSDITVTGIMIFVPVPKHISKHVLLSSISPDKDVEGICPTNMGKLFYRNAEIFPCTPGAIFLLLKSIHIPLAGEEIVIISRSPIIGQPLLIMLLESVNASPTVTCCHIATRDLVFHTKRADILIVAAGKPGLIHGDMIKENCIVIDVGINPIEKKENGKKIYSIVGDVDRASVEKKAAWLTPVPGGVGVVTTSILLQNAVFLAKKILP